MKEKQTSIRFPGFLSLLGLLFIGLKLTNHIDWSWWLVLLPVYAIPAFALTVMAAIVVCGLVVAILESKR